MTGGIVAIGTCLSRKCTVVDDVTESLDTLPKWVENRSKNRHVLQKAIFGIIMKMKRNAAPGIARRNLLLEVVC